MQLRDHWLMSYKGLSTWPPVWTHPYPESVDPITVKGEIGILTEVKMHALRSPRVFLRINHDGVIFIGCLFLDDPAFSRRVYEFLRECIGMPIKDIGDRDLSHLDQSSIGP